MAITSVGEASLPLDSKMGKLMLDFVMIGFKDQIHESNLFFLKIIN